MAFLPGPSIRIRITVCQPPKKALHMTARLVAGRVEFDGPNVDSSTGRARIPVQQPRRIPNIGNVPIRTEVTTWLSAELPLAVQITRCHRRQHDGRGLRA